jgi:D-alanine-D-alanine ligase
MAKLRIGLLNKKRGNFAIQEKFLGAENVVDQTDAEVAHHEQALTDAGYDVQRIRWGPHFILDLRDAQVDLVFNVSSLAEAAILEELDMPYVGSETIGIVIATDKSLAKKLWQRQGLPTSPFLVAKTAEDCREFEKDPPFGYPLFIKPVAGRGSAGINEQSVVHDYKELVEGVRERYEKIGQPVLVERFLKGREITLGILGNGDEARVLPPLEIAYQEGDVTLTYEKKELDDDVFFCPARLTEAQMHMMELIALQAYKMLRLRDFARFDTILTDQGPMLLEANSFAGLMCTPAEKPHSYIGFMARAEDKGGKELLDEIVQAAVKRLNLQAGG